MNKVLIAVKSCRAHEREDYHDAILDTWGRDIPDYADLKFFVGYTGSGAAIPTKNVVTLSCPDDYDSLPQKTKKICEHAVVADYDFAFLCDTDTYIIPDRLLSCGFQDYDIAGRFGNMPPLGSTFDYKDPRGSYPSIYGWPSGGVGYFLSRKAMKIVAASEPNMWAEDMFVGNCLGDYIKSGEIRAYDIPNFEAEISWHFPRRSFNHKVYHPSLGWMQEMDDRYRL